MVRDVFGIYTTEFSKTEQQTPLCSSTEVTENQGDTAKETECNP